MEETDFVKNAWDTCLELVSDRGYNVTSNYHQLTENDLIHMMNNNTEIICINSDGTKKICIKFVVVTRPKPSYLKELVEEIRKEIKDVELEIIFVLRARPNNSILKITKEFHNLQLMWIKQLQFNPTKHEQVPKHERLSSEEGMELLKKYDLASKQQLPILLRDDVIARYYNYKAGDIIKITNTASSHNKNYVFYRCVR